MKCTKCKSTSVETCEYVICSTFYRKVNKPCPSGFEINMRAVKFTRRCFSLLRHEVNLAKFDQHHNIVRRKT